MNDLAPKIDRFFDNAPNIFAQLAARNAWNEIKSHLNKNEAYDAQVAWDHALMGCGKSNLENVRKKIHERLKQPTV